MTRHIFITALTLLGLLSTQAAHAQTREIPYEGVLDDGGAPANGDYFFEFTLCDAQDCSGQQWQSGEVSLTATSGRFNASLGSAGQPALDDWIFSDDEVWLSIDVGDASGALTALAGVQKIVPNRFAISATEAAGDLETRIATLEQSLATTALDAGQLGDIRYSLLDEATFQSLHGAGWVLMDGRTLSAGTAYEALTGQSTLPDARGLFLRARNNGRADGFADAERAAGHIQSDLVGPHAHRIIDGFGTGVARYVGSLAPNAEADGAADGTTDYGSGIGNETRPNNMAVNIFIKVD